MVDENNSLLENETLDKYICRICMDEIKVPIIYCNCKEDLVFHSKCMERWINQENTDECDLCKAKFNLNYKCSFCYNLKNNIFSLIFFILIFIFLSSLLAYVIIIVIEDNNYPKLTVPFCIAVYIYMNIICNKQLIYSLFKEYIFLKSI